MRTKILAFASLVFTNTLGVGLAYAQKITLPETEKVPVIDGRSADLIGSIADTNLDQVTRDRIEKGVLIPKFGIEDIFMTKGSSTILDLQQFGPTCLTAYPGGIISTSDPPRDPTVKSRPRKIDALQQTGTAQLVVTADTGGKARCEGAPGELLKVYRFTITEADILRTLQELKSLVGSIEGLNIRVVGDRIVLDGQIVVPKELARLLKVVESFNNRPGAPQILSLYEISPLAFQLIAERMEEAIAGGPDRPRDIKVKVVNNRFFLEGSVDKRSQRDEAERICKAYIQNTYAADVKGVVMPNVGLPECNTSIWLRAGQPKEPDNIISVRVDFVTLSREYLKNFAFSWRPNVSTDGGAQYSTDLGRLTGNFTATVTSLFPLLSNAAQHGYGRILKSASLLVVDRQGQEAPPKASITETLDIPYNTVNGETGLTEVAYKQVTTNIGIQAKSVAGSDKIELVVDASQTEVKGQTQNGAAPSTLTNAVNTALVVTNEESAALGGMVGERRSVGYNRTPAGQGGQTGGSGTSNFELFGVGREQNFRDDKTQFIIFVTPRKMRNPEAGTEELKRKFRLRR